ncbi:polyketide synthase [Apiospora kogelbergensis]|uniref:polyketide synthase n=1 Tax=Apiospora kogelbergensis TaxID=1337665 RepID=UPI00312E7934
MAFPTSPTDSTTFSEQSDVMSALSTKIVFFGNDFSDHNLPSLFGSFQKHSRDRDFPFLSQLLTESWHMLQHELSLLPHELRDTVPQFQDIQRLVTFYASNTLCPLAPAISGALLCISQIAGLIGHHEADSSPYTLHHAATSLAGLSVGILAAAGVSVSTSLSDLVQTGVESARIAWRLGVHVNAKSQLLESAQNEGSPDSWAYVVTGLGVQEIQKELDVINSKSGHPELLKIFVSAADKSSVSVTGPPSRLKAAFHSSHILRYSKWLPLPVYGGLCHAPHLYTDKDAEQIVYESDFRSSVDRKPVLPLYSSQSGEPFKEKTYAQLLKAIAVEILTNGIYLDSLEAGLIGAVRQSSYSEMLRFGKSLVSDHILAEIQSQLPQLKISDDHQSLTTWPASRETTGINPTSPRNAKLAIVGMSCRLPGGAVDNEKFWQLMMDSRDVHSRIPADRFSLETHFDPTGKVPNSTPTPFGNFIDQPGMFDAEETDPMHRLALVTAYEALEMSGFSPGRTPSTNLKRIGTYYGVASDDWREANAGQNLGTYSVPGGERAFANGRINYFFKFGGPSFNMDTACSSGLAAVNAACSALWAGEADTVLAGGLNVISNPDNYCMLGRGHFLSLTGQCKVWDKDADGYCRADGCGAVVIKRLADAEADNDNVLAVVTAGATNHSAEAISITHPHAGAQMENYSQVLSHSGLSPLDLTYVELHGTGTQAGDAVESESVASIFAPVGARRKPEQRLHLGAVKSNIGHSEAAAGISSLIKALLVFQKGQIPPHVGIKTEINPVVAKNLDRRNAGLVLGNAQPWPRPEGNKKRYAMVNSFGAHGGNTSIILEDAPVRLHDGSAQPSPHHVFSVSAKSKLSLKKNLESLLGFLEQNPDTNAADLSYTLLARRIHYNFRVATPANSIEGLRKVLADEVVKADNIKSVSSNPVPIVMVFTGQGAFYDGLSAQLYANFKPYRKEVQDLDTLVQKLGHPSVLPYFIGGSSSADKATPLETQVSIVVLEIALTRFWKHLGVVPDTVIGHSLGEYAALVAAGVLSAADAIHLVATRAKSSPDTVAELVNAKKTPYEVSCKNGPRDTVLSGSREALAGIKAVLEENNIKTFMLDLPYAFHSAQMDPVLDEFERVTAHVTFKSPIVPIISPLLKDCIFDGKTIGPSYLTKATRAPVDFVGALDAARDVGLTDGRCTWLEVGPHPLGTAFVRGWDPEARTYASLTKTDKDNFAILSGTLAGLHAAGVPIAWQEWYRPHEKSLRLLELPSYCWNEKNYWIQHVGTWSLDKAFAGDANYQGAPPPVLSEETYDNGTRVRCVAQSDLKHPSLLPSVAGHEMNGFGCATSSIWADMAFTLGDYVYKLAVSSSEDLPMNMVGLEVLHAQVISKDTSQPHLIRMTAELDLNASSTSLQWSHHNPTSGEEEVWASCTIQYEDADSWKREWSGISHLVASRANELMRMGAEGSATRLNRKMAYILFSNVVHYSEKYQGMKTVCLSDWEACAEVKLCDEAHGNWHTAPHFFDSIFHVGGLVLNGGDAANHRDYFYVTPGWDSCRLLRRLRGGDRYRSMVRMAELTDSGDTNLLAGDVYVLDQNDAVVGLMKGMTFRRVPRILMNHFFSPAATTAGTTGAASAASSKKPKALPAPAKKPVGASGFKPHVAGTATKMPSVHAEPVATAAVEEPATAPPVAVAVTEAAAPAPDSAIEMVEDSGLVGDCMRIIAAESGLEMDALQDEASFMELGVDSLMSLVLADKFRNELQLEIKSSVFLECANIAAFKEWLNEYC